MWYLIFALLFGQGDQSSSVQTSSEETMEIDHNNEGPIGGEHSTPRPPRPPVKR